MGQRRREAGRPARGRTGAQVRGARRGGALAGAAPARTHRAERSPAQGWYRGCSHGWYRGCTPDSCWVEGYGCSALMCSMRGFREGEQV